MYGDDLTPPFAMAYAGAVGVIRMAPDMINFFYSCHGRQVMKKQMQKMIKKNILPCQHLKVLFRKIIQNVDLFATDQWNPWTLISGTKLLPKSV